MSSQNQQSLERVPLSKGLRSLFTSTLPSQNSRSWVRLQSLMKLDGPHTKELDVLRSWIKKETRSGRERYIVSIEYDFDDGALAQGRGDCVLVEAWSGRVIILEVKRIPANAPLSHATTKLMYVQSQALRYAHRLESWLRHIQAMNETNITMEVIPATLVSDERILRKSVVYKEFPGVIPS